MPGGIVFAQSRQFPDCSRQMYIEGRVGWLCYGQLVPGGIVLGIVDTSPIAICNRIIGLNRDRSFAGCHCFAITFKVAEKIYLQHIQRKILWL